MKCVPKGDRNYTDEQPSGRKTFCIQRRPRLARSSSGPHLFASESCRQARKYPDKPMHDAAAPHEVVRRYTLLDTGRQRQMRAAESAFHSFECHSLGTHRALSILWLVAGSAAPQGPGSQE
jgi:hypothetical protein